MKKAESRMLIIKYLGNQVKLGLRIPRTLNGRFLVMSLTKNNCAWCGEGCQRRY